MKTDINLKLRSEVLELALNVEENVNGLLLILLSIEDKKRKALSNRSGSLSFKNKIDLLFDLDVLTADEHQKLLLLMEFRNQFLHNIDCCYFRDAINILGLDKGNRLLKITDGNAGGEDQYQAAYKNLYVESLRICRKKVGDRKAQIEERRKLVVAMIEHNVFFIDRYFEMTKQVLLVCEEHMGVTSEAVTLAREIMKTIVEDQEALRTSEEFAQMRDDLDKLQAPEKIKAYFKR
jgi:hypothetical protein